MSFSFEGNLDPLRPLLSYMVVGWHEQQLLFCFGCDLWVFCWRQERQQLFSRWSGRRRKLRSLIKNSTKDYAQNKQTKVRGGEIVCVWVNQWSDPFLYTCVELTIYRLLCIFSIVFFCEYGGIVVFGQTSFSIQWNRTKELKENVRILFMSFREEVMKFIPRVAKQKPWTVIIPQGHTNKTFIF